TAIRDGCPPCRSLLKLDPAKLQGAVVSKNWIGDSSIQKQSWPVITERHFLAKLDSVERLSCIMDWLAERRYLPVLGRHFSIRTSEIRIGRWTTEWYAINSLID